MNHTIFSASRIIVAFAILTSSILVLAMLPIPAYADILFRQLNQGMSGADVSTLQEFLATDNTIYPQGLITGFFGPLTYSAVSNFQSRNGIETVGRVGPVTLAAINRLSGTGGSGDINAPVIANVYVNTSSGSATVGWTTNEDTQSTFYYSTSWTTLTENSANNPDTVSVAGNAIVSANSGLRTAHSVSVQNLQRDTVYYYAIHVTDQAGNVSVTWPTTFRTNP